MTTALTPPGTPPVETPPVVPPVVPPAVHFTDGFQSADIKAGIAAHNFGGPEELGRAYMELEHKIGAKGLIIPGEGATPEERAAFHQALGCPESPEKYDLSGVKPPGEGFQPDQPFIDAMKISAHKRGVPNATLAGLIEDAQAFQHQEVQQVYQDMVTRATQATDTIKVEWGAAYPAKIQAAQKAAQALFGPDAEKLQFTSGPDGNEIGNNPVLLKILAELGEKMGEHDLLPGLPQRLSQSADEAKAELQTFMADPANMDALMDNHDPRHKDVVARRDALYKAMKPSTENVSASTGVMVGRGVA